jgi:hypothetical protein
MKKTLLLTSAAFLFSLCSIAQTTVSIPAAKDNTLYENANGDLSNGVGSHLFAGQTQNNGVRRALIQFDLSSLPGGAVIDTVVLALNINKVNGAAGTDSLKLHVLNADWGEGTSNAPQNEGGGTTATAGDATWLHTFSPSSTWANIGGDFNAVASSAISTSGTGTVFFGGSQLIADVNNWLANPNQNFGWIVIGTEGPGISARRFGSKDGPTGGPSLRVTYLTTGISESEITKNLEVYPIPAEDYLVIEHRRNIFTNEVRVFDTNGKLVINKGLHMDNRLDVSELKSGIYFLELRTVDGNEAVTKKFVKN